MSSKTTVEWSKVRHFNPTKEKWGDPNKMMPVLIYKLDRMRDYVGRPFIVHEGFATTGHTKNSYHELGMAIDGHFKGMSVIDQFFAAEKFFGGNGIGIYGRDIWENPGLHIDMRPYPARWGKWHNCHTLETEYIPLSEEYIIYLHHNNLT